jgi:hypothetical protein
VVPTDDEVRRAAVLPHNRVPEGLGRPGHPHGRGSRPTTPFPADSGQKGGSSERARVDVTGLGDADDRVEEKVRAQVLAARIVSCSWAPCMGLRVRKATTLSHPRSARLERTSPGVRRGGRNALGCRMSVLPKAASASARRSGRQAVRSQRTASTASRRARQLTRTSLSGQPGAVPIARPALSRAQPAGHRAVAGGADPAASHALAHAAGVGIGFGVGSGVRGPTAGGPSGTRQCVPPRPPTPVCGCLRSVGSGPVQALRARLQGSKPTAVRRPAGQAYEALRGVATELH